MYKNLAIKGGGVKGVAYVGALEVLEENGLLKSIERYSGTSAGSLVATMLAVGFNAEEIKSLMLELDFKKFESGKNYLRIFTHYGLYSGNYILKFIHSFLVKSPHGLKASVTFREMKEAGCKDLYVFACDVSENNVQEFSADATPDAEVADAVRASMSIPFFFKAFRFKNNIPDSHIYVDGGTIYNYPLGFFDESRFCEDGDVNRDSIGLYLYAKNRKKAVPIGTRKPMKFAKELFESLMDSQDINVRHDRDLMERSIMIDDLEYPATDFNLTRQDMDRLIESGKNAATEFIHSSNNT